MTPVLPYLALAWAAVLAWRDLTRRRLDDALTLPAAVLVPAAAVLDDGTRAATLAVAGAACWAGAHLALAVAAPGSMGGGDVKLALPLGAAVGWAAVRSGGAGDLPVLLAAAVAASGAATAALGVVTRIRWRGGERNRDADPGAVPHGPGMLAGAALAVALAAA
ncbi:prepilin peptidase [Corynebacterium sp. 335C]